MEVKKEQKHNGKPDWAIKCDEMPQWRQSLIGWLVIIVIFGFEAWLVFLFLDWFEPMAISLCIWATAFWLLFPATGVFPNGRSPFH